MQAGTGILMRGFVKVTVIEERTGLKYVVYDDHNQIVNNGLTTMGQLIGQTVLTPANNKFASVRFGTSNAATSVTQTDVQGTTVATKAMSAVVEDVGAVPGVVQFTASLTTGEGNGNTIQEVAIVTAGAPIRMICRQVIPAIPKTNLITVGIDWIVQFSAV